MAKRKKAGRPRSEPVEPATPAPKVATSLGALLKQAKRDTKPAAKPGTKPGKKTPARAPRTQAPPPILPAPGPAPARPVPTLAPPAPAARVTRAVSIPPGVDAPQPLSAAEHAALARAFAGARPIARPARGRKHAPSPAAPAATPVDAALDRAARERLAALVGGGVRFELQRDGDEVTGLAAGTDARVLGRLCGRGLTPEATLDLHGMLAAEAGAAVERFLRAQKRAGRRYVLLIHGKGLHSTGGVGVLGDTVIEALTRGGAAPIVAAFATPSVRHGGSGALAVALR